MRIALISDLHGNAVALRAVLESIRESHVDRIVCLGDVATLGPSPHDVLDMLADVGCPCIRGNHDDFLLDADLVERYTSVPSITKAITLCREALSAAELSFVATFQPSLDMDMDGTSLALFHGSPRSNTEDLLATTPEPELDEALGPHRKAVMIGGHTHVQMLRQDRGTLLVNPGSVGLPFEASIRSGPPKILPHAEYAVVDSKAGAVSVSLRRVPLDRVELRRALEGWDNPLREELIRTYGD